MEAFCLRAAEVDPASQRALHTKTPGFSIRDEAEGLLHTSVPSRIERVTRVQGHTFRLSKPRFCAPEETSTRRKQEEESFYRR